MPESKDTKDDYQNLIDLLAVYSDATARLGELESEMNTAYLDLIDEQKAEYASLQQILTDTEKALREAVREHPEWLIAAKTIKTPFGQVQSRKTTSHEVADEPSAIARIKKAQARAIAAGKHDFAAQLGALIRVEESVNLDACGELEESELQKFGITRKIEENVTVKPVTISLGQAVKAADKRAKSKTGSEVPA